MTEPRSLAAVPVTFQVGAQRFQFLHKVPVAGLLLDIFLLDD